MAKRGLLTRRDYERDLKALEVAQRAMNEDEPEASQDPLVFTKADMERQRKAQLAEDDTNHLIALAFFRDVTEPP